MVVIRLSRGGTKKRPFYTIIAADRRAPRDGRYLERLGYFNPIATGGEKRLELYHERVNYWISQGAKPSVRITRLLQEETNPQSRDKRKIKNAARKTRQKEKSEIVAEASTIEA